MAAAVAIAYDTDDDVLRALAGGRLSGGVVQPERGGGGDVDSRGASVCRQIVSPARCNSTFISSPV